MVVREGAEVEGSGKGLMNGDNVMALRYDRLPCQSITSTTVVEYLLLVIANLQ